MSWQEDGGIDCNLAFRYDGDVAEMWGKVLNLMETSVDD